MLSHSAAWFSVSCTAGLDDRDRESFQRHHILAQVPIAALSHSEIMRSPYGSRNAAVTVFGESNTDRLFMYEVQAVHLATPTNNRVILDTVRCIGKALSRRMPWRCKQFFSVVLPRSLVLLAEKLGS